ncbi:MAG: entericidin A/B family lipoprotein [Gammaproteobacteria bacterium]|jgi:predicted small secreted protein
MKKFLFLVITVISVYGLLLAGCSTVEGIGQDIQSGGHAISKAASKNTKK